MYRVDKRLFEVDAIIKPSVDSFQESNDFDENKHKLENVLAKESPNSKSTARSNSLYLFTYLSDALKFSINMSNSKVYEVKPAKESVCFHRGDMIWTELMYKFIKYDDFIQKMAENYWNGVNTYKPCWELLLDKALVTSVIINDERERNELKRSFYENSGNFEKIHFYTDNISK